MKPPHPGSLATTCLAALTLCCAHTASAAPLYSLAPPQAALARRLAHLQLGLHVGVELAALALLILLLESGLAQRVAHAVAQSSSRAWLQTILFVAALLLLLNGCILLPADAIRHSALLQAGISVQSWPAWLRDQALITLLMLVVGTPVLVLARWLLTRSPRRAWLWFWLASIPVILAAAFVLPQLVEPLFNHFEPLADSHPQLVKQFQRVVARTGTPIPPQRMFLMRASSKVNGFNAYVSGLGPTQRIVVWDTTADRMPADEILFILAHECGHYVLHHLLWGLTLGILGTLLLLWLTFLLAHRLLRLRGHRWRIQSLDSLSGLVVVLLALVLLEILSEPIGNSISRAFEHQADVYAQEALHGIVPDPQTTAVAAFQQLGQAWLEDPNPNPLVVFWTFDHPSIQSRANFAAHYNPWIAGGHPRFFSAPQETPAAGTRNPLH